MINTYLREALIAAYAALDPGAGHDPDNHAACYAIALTLANDRRASGPSPNETWHDIAEYHGALATDQTAAHQ